MNQNKTIGTYSEMLSQMFEMTPEQKQRLIEAKILKAKRIRKPRPTLEQRIATAKTLEEKERFEYRLMRKKYWAQERERRRLARIEKQIKKEHQARQLLEKRRQEKKIRNEKAIARSKARIEWRSKKLLELQEQEKEFKKRMEREKKFRDKYDQRKTEHRGRPLGKTKPVMKKQVSVSIGLGFPAYMVFQTLPKGMRGRRLTEFLLSIDLQALRQELDQQGVKYPSAEEIKAKFKKKVNSQVLVQPTERNES